MKTRTAVGPISRRLGPSPWLVCLHCFFCAAVTLVLDTKGAAAQTIYVAFGDSITFGVGDTRAGQPGYPGRLQALLSSGDVVRNRGLGGERTPEGLTRLDSVLAEGGDVLLLMEGTNDISREYSVESILFNLGQMTQKAKQAGFETIQATTIPRLPNAKVDRENLTNQILNQRIRNQAGLTGRRLVDNFEVFSRLAKLFTNYYSDSPNDPVGHPNGVGYDVVADHFAQVISNIDTVPPVPGILFPENKDRNISPTTSIVVDVWDFGNGIDLGSLRLFVNGKNSGAAVNGDSRGATFSYQPAAPLSGSVVVELEADDQSNPPQRFDHEISRFFITGTEFQPGDLNFDGTVDNFDLDRLSSGFGLNDGQNNFEPALDLDGDGHIDGIDLAIMARDFGTSI